MSKIFTFPIAVAFIAGAFVATVANWSSSQPMFALTQDVDGQVYVLDHALTAQDCLGRIDGFGSAVRCEVER